MLVFSLNTFYNLTINKKSHYFIVSTNKSFSNTFLISFLLVLQNVVYILNWKNWNIKSPGRCTPVGWALYSKPEDSGFNFQPGDMTRLRVQSGWSTHKRQPVNVFFSYQCFYPSLSPSLLIFLKSISMSLAEY